jgi:hypothetical protein
MKTMSSFYTGSISQMWEQSNISMEKAFEFLNYSQDSCKEMAPRLQVHMDGLLGEGSVVVEVGTLELIVSTNEMRYMDIKKPDWCWCPVKFKYTGK